MSEIHTFGDWLHKTREDQGFNKTTLANASGVDRAYIHRIEEGKVLEPGPEVREKLHRALHTSDEDLVAVDLMEKRTFDRPDGETVIEYRFKPQFIRHRIGRPNEEGGIDWEMRTITRTAEAIETQALRELAARYDTSTPHDKLKALVDRMSERQATALLLMLEVFEDAENLS